MRLGRNPATARKGDPLVLKTANEGHGFFGTTALQYGQAVAEYAWAVAFKELLKGGWKPYTVRLFLDAKWGRHLADQIYIQGIADKAKIRTAVLKALKSEMKWIVRTMPDMDAERRKGGVRWNPQGGGANPGRTLVPGGKGRDSVHPGRAGAPASARWVTISSRHKMFFKGPWGKNPSVEWHLGEAKRMMKRSRELGRKGLQSMATKYRHMAGDQEYSAAVGRVSANPTYLLTPRICDLRTIATSGVAGVVDGRKIDPVIAGAVLKFLAAQSDENAARLAKDDVGLLIQYVYKNAKRR